MGWGSAAIGLMLMLLGGITASFYGDLLRRREERSARSNGYRTWDGSRPRGEWPPDGFYEMSRGVGLLFVAVGALVAIVSAVAGLLSLL